MSGSDEAEMAVLEMHSSLGFQVSRYLVLMPLLVARKSSWIVFDRGVVP